MFFFSFSIFFEAFSLFNVFFQRLFTFNVFFSRLFKLLTFFFRFFQYFLSFFSGFYVFRYGIGAHSIPLMGKMNKLLHNVEAINKLGCLVEVPDDVEVVLAVQFGDMTDA